MGAGALSRSLTRRALLRGAALAPLGALAACTRAAPQWDGGWVDTGMARGHRLRDLLATGQLPAPALTRRAGALVLGAGIGGLAAARTLAAAGIDDVQVLELADAAGGNSRGHVMGGMACPLGAHYLPLPGEQAHEVAALLHELGLLRTVAGRTVADERHLCHSPQERLFIDGAWVDGLLPPAEPGSATLAQYRRFAAAVGEAQRTLGFSLPTTRAPWTDGHRALDAITFAQWLDMRGLTDERLRWYLDYCCRDDYGAGTKAVSAWAGLHYFASRHGFHAPGDAEGEREPVFTWPEGNAWLVRRMAEPLGERLHTGFSVLRVQEERHEVAVLVWNEQAQQAEAWRAPRVVVALPLFVAARLLDPLPAALQTAAAQQPRAPWLVANLQLDGPLTDRLLGAPLSWDNVRYGGDPRALGYVDAMHQSTRPVDGPTVLSVYWALPVAERAALLQADWRSWAARVVADLSAVHPDLPRRVQRADLARHGHAMSIPVPGLRGSPALTALRAARGRVRFAHADLAGYSVFEEACTAGVQAVQRWG
jgi:predicted NAD/FAD-dependent oxidoreductase